MGTIKFIKQKTFEKLASFEKRLQDEVSTGWKVHSFTSDHGSLTVMLLRER